MTVCDQSPPASLRHEFSYYEDLWQDVAVDDAEVSLRINVPAIPTTAPQQAAHLATQALQRLSSGDWQLTQMLWGLDDGPKGAVFLASARLPLEQLDDLAQRAAEVSSDNVVLTEPMVQHGAAADTQLKALQDLALRAFSAAETQAERLSAETKRTWRVAEVDCHCPRQFPLANVARTKHLADATASQMGGEMPSRHRLSLLAHIRLTFSIPEAV